MYPVSAIKDELDLLKLSVDRSFDQVLWLDFEGNILYANETACRILGYTHEELCAMKISELDPAFRSTAREKSGLDLRERKNQFITTQHRCKDGKLIDVEILTVYINNKGREFIFAYARDITVCKQAESSLRESEEKFRSFVENANEILFSLTPDGVFTYVSPNVTDLLGYEICEVVGKKSADFIHPDDFSRIREVFLLTLHEGKKTRGTEYRVRHKDDTWRWHAQSISPLRDTRGKVAAIQGISNDITERIATQSAIQAVVGSMVGSTGLNSLQKISENVSTWLGADCVMIGEIQPDNQTVRVLSMLLDKKVVHDFTYTLKGTPCENVTEKGFCHYPDDAIRLFPNSRDLVDLNIRGYIGTPVRNSDGCVTGILCALFRNPVQSSPSVKEILEIIAVKAGAEIERLRMERELRESEEKYRSIVETSPDMIWEIDLKGKFRYMSPRVQKIMGYTPEEIIGKSMIDLAPEAGKSATLQALEQMISSEGELSPIELPACHRNGSDIILEIRPSRVTGTDGRMHALRGVSVDITERRRAETAFLKNQYLLSEAMEMAHMADWELDALTGIFTFNDRFYALFGTTAEREGGYQMSAEVYAREFTHPDDQHIVAEEISKSLSTPESECFAITEHRIIRRDGEVRYIVVRIRVDKDSEGRTIKTHGANQDITERRKAEEAIKAANRQLTLLNGITRHDIINKVSIILGFLKFTEMKFTDPKLAEYLKKIESATRAIHEQIEFTKIYENLGTHEPQWIVIDSIMPRRHLPDTITLYAEITGISLYADSMLEKVFLNLLDNSIRHGERVTEIMVSSFENAGNLVIVWQDNGVGLSADEKVHIFERGFGKNTGLGMFLVREILSLTGITITETGEPGSGARFEILVPNGAYRVCGV